MVVWNDVIFFVVRIADVAISFVVIVIIVVVVIVVVIVVIGFNERRWNHAAF